MTPGAACLMSTNAQHEILLTIKDSSMITLAQYPRNCTTTHYIRHVPFFRISWSTVNLHQTAKV